jgi:excisionase family DNA binding protein
MAGTETAPSPAGPAAFAAAMERALTAALARAEAAEAELAALADRIGAAIRAAAAERERAERAEAEAGRLRDLLAGQGRAGEAKEYLSHGEAARRLQVHPRTLQKWEAEKVIAADRTAGNHRRYRAGDVERLRRKREAPGG